MSSTISSKIERIRNVFQDAKMFAEATDDHASILNYLSTIDKEYAAVACEGAAMSIALKDIAAGDELTNWTAFLKHAPASNELQMHIGLGWALAQESRSPLPYLEQLSPLMRYRMLDGYGYYDGTCRVRHSIRAQKVPEGLTGTVLSAYTQGIGRSVWYVNLGDPAKIAEMISKFPLERQAALWRGVGSAGAFVGGSDAAMLEQMPVAAQQFQAQLCTGTALAVRGRAQLGYIAEGTEAACKAWCRQSVNEAMQLTETALASAKGGNAYESWITALDKHYQSSEVMS